MKTFQGRRRRARRGPAAPADGARLQQVRALRPLRAAVQRARGGGRLRLRQSRLRHRGPARPGRLPPRHRVREPAGSASAPAPPARSPRSSPWPSPVPWRTSRVESVCHYCSAGCRLAYEVSGATLVQVSRGEEAGTGSNHCRKGRFGLRPRSVARAPPEAAPGAAGASCRRRASTRPCATPPMRLRELTRRYKRRPGRRLRLSPADERGDLPRPEAGPAGSANAQRHLADPPREPGLGCPGGPVHRLRRGHRRRPGPLLVSSTRRSTTRDSRWTSRASRRSARAPA